MAHLLTTKDGRSKLILATLVVTTLFISSCAKYEGRLPDDPQNEIVNPKPDDGLAPKPGGDMTEPDFSENQEDQILRSYAHFDPKKSINATLLKKAKLYFHANKNRFTNQKYIIVIDYALSSKKKRFHMIDVIKGSVWSTYVAHGKGSDSNHDGYAESFSNSSGSNATSLGAFKTAETYNGSNGYSLRLDGLSSTNSKARARAIVIHGADYVQDRSVIQGRSWGCPALPQAYKTNVINQIKNGSLIYTGLGT